MSDDARTEDYVRKEERQNVDVDPKLCPDSVHKGERAVFDFKRLSEYGVLWLINRTVFHPRGFALALDYVDGQESPVGWSMQGDGSEPWRFEGFNEDEKFAAIEGLLAQARQFGKAPHFVAGDEDAAPHSVADEHLDGAHDPHTVPGCPYCDDNNALAKVAEDTPPSVDLYESPPSHRPQHRDEP